MHTRKKRERSFNLYSKKNLSRLFQMELVINYLVEYFRPESEAHCIMLRIIFQCFRMTHTFNRTFNITINNQAPFDVFIYLCIQFNCSSIDWILCAYFRTLTVTYLGYQNVVFCYDSNSSQLINPQRIAKESREWVPSEKNADLYDHLSEFYSRTAIFRQE